MFDTDTNSDARSRALFRRSALFAAVLTTTAGGVWAQEKSSFLEETIVTASKRTESLLDSAVAVTVITGDITHTEC